MHVLIDTLLLNQSSCLNPTLSQSDNSRITYRNVIAAEDKRKKNNSISHLQPPQGQDLVCSSLMDSILKMISVCLLLFVFSFSTSRGKRYKFEV